MQLPFDAHREPPEDQIARRADAVSTKNSELCPPTASGLSASKAIGRPERLFRIDLDHWPAKIRSGQIGVFVPATAGFRDSATASHLLAGLVRQELRGSCSCTRP
jgi:hypothetical protein